MLRIAALAVVSAFAVASCNDDPVYPFFGDTTLVPDSGGDVADDDTTADVAPDATGDTDRDVAPDASDADPTDADDADVADVAPDVPPRRAIGEECGRNSDCLSTVCVPVASDRFVCSASCDEGCPAGWECDGGFCGCEATVELCDGVDNDCDAVVDEGAAATIGCGGAEECVDGFCACPAGGLVCDDVCVDAQNDRDNCGACGEDCGADTICRGGACVCPDDYTICGGACVDTQTDAAHCGECGESCPDGLTCDGGSCACPGASGLFCDGRCIDSESDRTHCGECGNGCGSGEVCAGGACECAIGFERCGGQCIDVRADEDNCGGCDIVCGGGDICVAGACVCPAGTLECGDGCVDVESDEDNCGGCGVECDPGDVCSGGVCGCPFGTTGCAGACVDTDADVNNCGGCGISCGGSEVCEDGECACPCPGDACETGRCLRMPRGAAAASFERSIVLDPQRADVFFNLDTTGSMGEELTALRSAITDTIAPAASEAFSDVGFGISTFEDFPCDGYGNTGDLPYLLVQAVTESLTTFESAVAGITLGIGGDGPESGFEGLYQLSTGAGRTGSTCYTITPGRDAGFREGALPIVVHITDAISRTAPGATSDDAADGLTDIGARFIGIASGTSAVSQLRTFATAVDSAVPACAWGTTGRPSGCGATQCCTGTSGAGQAAGTDDLCPLVFSVASNGTGLGSAVTRGLEAAARVSGIDVTATAIHTTAPCLSPTLEVSAVTPPADLCGDAPELTDRDEDGVDDTVAGAVAGTAVEYEVTIENDCITAPGVYPVTVSLANGNTQLDPVTYYIHVP